MPYIPLDENLPGITGLLNYRQDTAFYGRLAGILKTGILKTSGYLSSPNKHTALTPEA